MENVVKLVEGIPLRLNDWIFENKLKSKTVRVKSQLSAGTWSSLVNGKIKNPSANVLISIATAWNIDLNYLMLGASHSSGQTTDVQPAPSPAPASAEHFKIIEKLSGDLAALTEENAALKAENVRLKRQNERQNAQHTSSAHI